MMSFKDYQALPGINASFLKACIRSEWHGWMYLNSPKMPTSAMELGSAIHCALLEPVTFMSQYVVEPEFTGLTKQGKESKNSAEAKEKREAWISSLGDTQIISQENLDLINRIKSNCYRIPSVKEALETFEAEKTLTWEYGLPMKARLDLVNLKENILIDIKTATNADPIDFTKQSINLGYDVQLLHYARGVKFANKTGIDPTIYALAIETSSGGVKGYNLDQIVYSDFTLNRYIMAMHRASRVLEMRECPPRFDETIENLFLPAWAEKEFA